MSNETEAAKGTRSRSPAYPLIPLGEAVDAVRKLWDAQRKQEARTDSVLSSLGYSSKNGTALRLIAALQQYGLLEGTGSGDNRKLRISESAQDIIHLPPEDERYQTALTAAALAPTIHQILWDRYGKVLPLDSAIRPFLIRDRGFNNGIVDSVIKNYRDTYEYAKLAKTQDPSEKMKEDDRKQKEEEAKGRGFFNSFLNPFPGRDKPQPAQETKSEQSEERPVSADQLLPIPVGKNRFANIPYPMTSAAYKMLLSTLELWKQEIVQDPPVRTDHAARAIREHFSQEPEEAPESSKRKHPVQFPARAMWRNQDHDQPVSIIGSFGEREGEMWYESSTHTGIRGSELDFEPRAFEHPSELDFTKGTRADRLRD